MQRNPVARVAVVLMLVVGGALQVPGTAHAAVQNQPPTISAFEPLLVPENTVVPPIPFTIGDPDDPIESLTITATSDNQELVPDASLVIGGSGASRRLTATPQMGRRGIAYISVVVSDGVASSFSILSLYVVERTYYLAEGATGDFFDTDILLANPNIEHAPVTIRFLQADGTSIVQTRTLPPMSRTTIQVDAIPGLEATTFSTLVSSTNILPIVVERTMRWNASGYGAHTESATNGAGPTWYFAEGAQGFFSTYYLLASPHDVANVAHVTYFREGAAALTRDYVLAPHSRTTIDASADPELRGQAFGARIDFDLPGMAERSMYFGTDPLWLGGSAAAGVVAPSSQWVFAEGATGDYFTTFILLANPTDLEVTVELTYLPDTGIPVEKRFEMAPRSRVTRNIALEAPSLVNAAVATRIRAGAPIVAERAQYWGQPAWIESHTSMGQTENHFTRWGIAEGRVGGPNQAQTYILLANPSPDPATVTIEFLRETGAPIVKVFTVKPTSRLNVAVSGAHGDVPELVDESFGARIVGTQAIFVEHSIYWNANGVTWAAGSNAGATPLP